MVQAKRDAAAAGVGSAGAVASEAGASQEPIREPIVVNGTDPSALTVEAVEAQKAGGVNVWVGSGVGEVDGFRDFMAKNSNAIVPVSSVADIRDAHSGGRLAHVSQWQSADQLVLQGSYPMPAISALADYHALGLRICGIAYNLANAFGGGCLDPQIGLTHNGRQLVQEIHELKIVLDVGGHTGEQTSLEALAMSSGVPVVCTHTNCRGLVDNPRNTSDRLMEAIAETGGVIGVTAFNDFHARTSADRDVFRTPQVELEKHLDHYDYLKKLVGVDHIGLAPDFMMGSTGEWPNDRLNPNGSVSSRAPEAYSRGTDLYVKGFENITELPNIPRGLAQRGWSPEEIHKVMGGNWLRVYRQVWGA